MRNINNITVDSVD